MIGSSGNGNGPSQWTPNEVSATAIWAYGARTVAQSAEALGRSEDAAKYRALFARIRADFQVAAMEFQYVSRIPRQFCNRFRQR